ncbi:MAG: hypothetical protein KDA90_18905 [Planctomycetaceae bacterium]|nr:hypothetical protein [Planctomycetaceae bacterium]
MIDFDFLDQGVRGLANAHKAGTMAGHLGAAVAAGYFIGEDHSEWAPEVFVGVAGELKRILAGEEAIWWNAKKAGVSPADLFQALPKGGPRPAQIDSIVETLRQNVGETRQSGHNIIFASIAVRALRDHPEFATPAIIEGVRKLIAGFNSQHAGRGYYGKPEGWKTGAQVTVKTDDGFVPYKDIPEMVAVTLDELIATAPTKKQGFGGLWHIVNHAAAIVELDRHGYGEVAQLALPAHHHHIRLWRSLPDVESELGAVGKSTHDPRDPAYWVGMLKRDEARLTHRIKTLYGYYTIRNFVESADKKNQTDDAFLYLMD